MGITKKYKLTKKESDIYEKTVEYGTMDDMFDVGYAIGRVHAMQEYIKKNYGLNIGGKNGNVKLKKEMVLKIRSYKGKEGLKETAVRFNVSLSTVWNIQNYKTWKHLKSY